MRFLQETGCGGKIARGDEIIKWPGVHLWDHRQWVGMGRCHSLAIWIVPFWALEHLIPTPQMSTRPSSPGLYPTSDSGQLPSTASNLIVPYSCTDCFYLLSKIHKQDCPGRSIVSACSCPTELVSKYLNSILFPPCPKPLTYIWDTAHTLQLFNNLSFLGLHCLIFTHLSPTRKISRHSSSSSNRDPINFHLSLSSACWNLYSPSTPFLTPHFHHVKGGVMCLSSHCLFLGYNEHSLFQM